MSKKALSLFCVILICAAAICSRPVGAQEVLTPSAPASRDARQSDSEFVIVLATNAPDAPAEERVPVIYTPDLFMEEDMPTLYSPDAFTEDGIPAAIANFVAKYPEAASFAENYVAEHEQPHDRDLSAEYAEGQIPLLIQWDARWGYERYGNNYLGVNGCGPACMAMVVCGLTGDLSWNPYKMAQFCEEKGYYVQGRGTLWDLMTSGAQALGLSAVKGDVTEEYIRKHLSAQTPIICSMKPGDFTYSGHFIVLVGWDEDGNIIIRDPNSPEKSSRSWPVATIVAQAKGVWCYSAPVR